MIDLIEGEDFYYEERDGFTYRVFTERYFLKYRKYCCGNKCRHCIYEPKFKTGSILINSEIISKFGNKNNL